MDKQPLTNQRGVALLLFLVVLIAIAGIFVSNLLSKKAAEVTLKKIDHDYGVLRKAKQALLSYAVDYSLTTYSYDDMGRLPCPDLRTSGPATTGVQDSPCGARHMNSAGFLPWKTLGIADLRDSSSECLWYVVSGDYKTGPNANMRNEDSNGLLQVQDENGQLYHGLNPGDRPIALIIAPGGALKGQSHLPDCRGNSNEDDYLESGGSVTYSTAHDASIADKIWTYVYGTASSRLENSNFNDKMVWITKDEYWDTVKALNDLDINVPGSEIEQLTADLTQCFADYANDGAPSPSAVNENFWLPWPADINLAEYRNDADTAGVNGYIDQNNASSLIGRLPQSVFESDSEEFKLTLSQVATHADKTDIFESCLTAERKEFWRNWKDHFFYVVSSDFEMVDGSTASLSARCALAGDCLNVSTIAGVPVSKKIAAIVFYSGSVVNAQSRNSPPVDIAEKNILSNYLDSYAPSLSNAHDYPVDTTYSGDVATYYNDIGDLVYCIWINAGAIALEAGKCI
jgi:hypothetical protein